MNQPREKILVVHDERLDIAPETPVEQASASPPEFAAGAGQSDDISMLSLLLQGAGPAAAAA